MTPGQRSPDGQAVSHFPLERDPDSESPPELQGVPIPRVPGPPRLPQADARPRTKTAALGAEPGGTRRGSGGSLAGRSIPRPTAQHVERRRALLALVDRVAGAVDLAPLDVGSPVVSASLSQQIDIAIRTHARAMQNEAEPPGAIDLEQLVDDALRELVGLGPIGPLLEDPNVEEVHVARPDCVLAVRKGQASLVDPSFTSEEALARVVARLAQLSEPQQPRDAILDRRLDGGERMTAVGPPVANGWKVTIRKPLRAQATLDEQVRAAAMSQAMATFLEACVVARANLLVVGSHADIVSSTVAALASAAGSAERIAVLTEDDEIAVAHAYVMPFALGCASGGADAVRAAARLHPDRFIVLSLAGPVAAATLDAIGEGMEGVVAGLCGPSLRHGLARLAAQVALVRTGASMDSAREAVAESFDIAVEVTRGIDGRLRLARVAELAGADAVGIILRDLFLSSADATGESGFIPTGAVPRLAQDFAARGIRLEGALFKRR